MYQLFYVLNGLINGEAGVEAVKIGGGDPSDLMTDGHYFSVEGDVDGRGPFRSIDEARAAAEAHQLTQVWCVTRDSPPTRRLVEPDDGEPEQDLVYVTKISDNSYMCVTKISDNSYMCVLTGAYEDLTLYMSASSFCSRGARLPGRLPGPRMGSDIARLRRMASQLGLPDDLWKTDPPEEQERKIREYVGGVIDYSSRRQFSLEDYLSTVEAARRFSRPAADQDAPPDPLPRAALRPKR